MEESKKYSKAKKRVEDIKGFYQHLIVYLLVNIGLIVLRSPIMVFFADNTPPRADENFLEWLDLNLLVTPLVWGIGLLIHGIAVFGATPGFVKKWEKRKINEYLEEDNNTQKWL